jgi:hypothetical protein
MKSHNLQLKANFLFSVAPQPNDHTAITARLPSTVSTHMWWNIFVITIFIEGPMKSYVNCVTTSYRKTSRHVKCIDHFVSLRVQDRRLFLWWLNKSMRNRHVNVSRSLVRKKPTVVFSFFPATGISLGGFQRMYRTIQMSNLSMLKASFSWVNRIVHGDVLGWSSRYSLMWAIEGTFRLHLLYLTVLCCSSKSVESKVVRNPYSRRTSRLQYFSSLEQRNPTSLSNKTAIHFRHHIYVR